MSENSHQDFVPASHSNPARGFAVMDKARQKEIASAGGRAAHAQGHAHEFTTTEATSAGRKGGISVSRNRVHMADIGRLGGVAKGKKKQSEA